MTDIIVNRRKFLGGLAVAFAAPIIVQASNIMPVREFVSKITYPVSLPDYPFRTYRIIASTLSRSGTELTLFNEETGNQMTSGWTGGFAEFEVGDYISISGPAW